MQVSGFLFLRNFGFALLGALLLSACLTATQNQPATHTVLRNEVTVAGPSGFCLSSVGRRARGTVVFGSCNALGQSDAGGPFPTGAVVIISVGTKMHEDTDPELISGLQDFFATEAGRTALSQSDNPSRITVHSAEANDAALYLRLEDQSDNFETGLENRPDSQ